MTDLRPVRADLTGIRWPTRVALCALAGGPATWLDGSFIDRDGKRHEVEVMAALTRRQLAVRTRRPDGRKSIRLTDKGRWYAATALGEMADILTASSMEFRLTGTAG